MPRHTTRHERLIELLMAIGEGPPSQVERLHLGHLVEHAEAAEFFEWYDYGTERLPLERLCPLDGG